MVDIAIDIETYDENGEPILDSTKFTVACLIKENKQTPEIYWDKNKLWERVLEIGKAEEKRGKTLNVYSHNASYDFYGYANLTDKNLKWYSHSPFIVSYIINGKEVIKFLDTMSIYKRSLKRVGDLIGIEKLELPMKIDEETDKLKLLPYLIRDTKICLESIKEIKRKLKEEKIGIKRLYTINQIAIQYLINKLKRLEDTKTENLFFDKERGMINKTWHPDKIHSAYRGGKVEAFKTGWYNKVTYIDFNSLYPYSACKIRFPNLKSEKLTLEPLKKGFTQEQILRKIGITKAIIKNNYNGVPIIPIRTSTGNYYPKEGKVMIGTWTNEELQYAKDKNYEIIDIEWTLTYEENYNPLKEIMKETYIMRKKSETEFDNYFYKMMMNASIGKLAQRKTKQEFKIDSVEEAEKYVEQKWKIVKGIEYDYMYKKEEKGKSKKYYCPIIPTLINAKARIIMHKEMSKIPKEDLLYTDTDSIIFLGEHLNKFDIGNEIGQFKIEAQNETIKIYGKKTYQIGEETKVSGFRKKGIKKEDFLQGTIKSKKMNTMLTTNNINKVGTFKEETRNLNELRENNDKIETIYDKETIFIDNDIEDLNYFVLQINEIFK